MTVSPATLRRPADPSLKSGGVRLSRPVAVMLVLAGLIVTASLVTLNMGEVQISPLQVLRTLLGQGSERDELVLFQLRMPRMTLAMLIGIGLALSGAIMQSISRNGLADPGLLGINAGAGVGVIGLLLFVGRDMTGANENPLQAAPFLLFPVVAFGGAFLAALLVYVLAYKNGEVTPSRLILVGVAVGFGLAAITLLLSLKLHPWIYQIAVLWLAGSITITTWKSVLTLLPWIVVLAPFVFYKARVLNVLNLGDSVATGLGTAVERQRLVLLAAAVGLAASSVAVGGGIAFVGLLGPHIARRLVGPRHEVMLPTAALVGALLLVIADIPARNLLAPIEIPTGIVVAIIGVPYFLYLLVRTA